MNKQRFRLSLTYACSYERTDVFVEKLFKTVDEAKKYAEKHYALLRPMPNYKCVGYNVEPVDVKTVAVAYGTCVRFEMIEV